MKLLNTFGLMIGALSLVAFSLTGCKPPEDTGGGTGPGGTAATRPMPTAEGNTMEGDEILIGVIAALQGPQKPWGEDSVRGIQLAVEAFNEAGGLDGKKIRLIIEDTASRPEVSKSATEKLIHENKVLVVIGEIASGQTQPAAQVAQDAGVPLMSPGATRVDITEIGAAIFRSCFTDNFQGAAMAKFAYDDLNLRKVAVLTDKKQPYSTGLSDVFKQVFDQLGGEIVDEQFYETDNVDFQAQLTNIASKNPDGLFCSGYFNEVGPIARQRRQIRGLADIPILGGDGWDSRELLQSGGAGLIGGYWSNHYSNLEDRQIVRDFVAAFTARFGQAPATAMAALSYDAAGIVIDAIKRAETVDSRGILNAISQTTGYVGVSGTITIGPDGNPKKPLLVLQVTREGNRPVKQIEYFEFEG